MKVMFAPLWTQIVPGIGIASVNFEFILKTVVDSCFAFVFKLLIVVKQLHFKMANW